MKRLRAFVRRDGFAPLVTVVGICLLGWPVVTIPDTNHSVGLGYYLFGVWALLIAALAVHSLANPDTDSTAGDQ